MPIQLIPLLDFAQVGPSAHKNFGDHINYLDQVPKKILSKAFQTTSNNFAQLLNTSVLCKQK